MNTKKLISKSTSIFNYKTGGTNFAADSLLSFEVMTYEMA